MRIGIIRACVVLLILVAVIGAIATLATRAAGGSTAPRQASVHHRAPPPQAAPFYVPPAQLINWVGPSRVYLRLPYNAKEWQRQLAHGHLQRQDMVAIVDAHDRAIGLFRADYLRAFLALREATR